MLRRIHTMLPASPVRVNQDRGTSEAGLANQAVQRLCRALEPVIIVLGDAQPLVDEAVGSLLEAALARSALPAFNHSTWRAGEPESVGAFGAARTVPLAAELRVVAIRDLHLGTAAFYEAFTDYLADPSPTTVLIAAGEKFPRIEKGSRNWGALIKKAMKESGTIVTLSSRDVRPARFARDHASALGKTLRAPDAELLVALAGDDLGRLAREIEKVALYVGEGEAIDADAIHAACSMLAEAVIWDLSAGLATQDAERALGALHRLEEGGDDARKLLGMIAWQLRELGKASEMVRKGASDGQIRGTLRMRADVLRRLRPQLQAGFPSAAALLRRIATANREMNSHRAGDRRILDGFVLEWLAR